MKGAQHCTRVRCLTLNDHANEGVCLQRAMLTACTSSSPSACARPLCVGAPSGVLSCSSRGTVSTTAYDGQSRGRRTMWPPWKSAAPVRMTHTQEGQQKRLEAVVKAPFDPDGHEQELCSLHAAQRRRNCVAAEVHARETGSCRNNGKSSIQQ